VHVVVAALVADLKPQTAQCNLQAWRGSGQAPWLASTTVWRTLSTVKRTSASHSGRRMRCSRSSRLA